jgi:hypothetical protein
VRNNVVEILRVFHGAPKQVARAAHP